MIMDEKLIYISKTATQLLLRPEKNSVITGQGKIDKLGNGSPEDPKRWEEDPEYVEIKPNENHVIYPNKERWERDDWPPV
jgi:hypothetical protein